MNIIRGWWLFVSVVVYSFYTGNWFTNIFLDNLHWWTNQDASHASGSTHNTMVWCGVAEKTCWFPFLYILQFNSPHVFWVKTFFYLLVEFCSWRPEFTRMNHTSVERNELWQQLQTLSLVTQFFFSLYCLHNSNLIFEHYNFRCMGCLLFR